MGSAFGNLVECKMRILRHLEAGGRLEILCRVRPLLLAMMYPMNIELSNGSSVVR
jgi:hypothetical protein